MRVILMQKHGMLIVHSELVQTVATDSNKCKKT